VGFAYAVEHGYGVKMYKESVTSRVIVGACTIDKTFLTCRYFRRTQIATCRGHRSAVTSVKMTKSGTGLLSASLDATMILWDVVNASPVRVFMGHKGPVTEVILVACRSASKFAHAHLPVRPFSRQGIKHRLDLQILMLEPQDETFIDPNKKKSRIFGYTRFVVSASMDGTIRVWNVMTGIDECYTVCVCERERIY